MGIRRFEDILAWQSARRLVVDVYTITRTQPFMGERAFRDQLQRASVSTMSNIAEGFERDTAKDFLRFLSMARASNAEVRSLLYVARDIELIDDSQFQRLMAAANDTSRLVSAFKKSIEYRTNGIGEETETYTVSPDTDSSTHS